METVSLSKRYHAPKIINLIPSLASIVNSCVTVTANTFKVVPIQGYVRIINVVRR